MKTKLMFMEDEKVEINSQLIRIARMCSFLKSLRTKIVIKFFKMFFDAGVF